MLNCHQDVKLLSSQIDRDVDGKGIKKPLLMAFVESSTIISEFDKGKSERKKNVGTAPAPQNRGKTNQATSLA